jgi:hypothetical protein
MLCCRGRSDGALGLLKHSEKLIRATVDLTPLMLTDRGAKNTPQLSQHRRVVVLAKPLYETGRALDIREQMSPRSPCPRHAPSDVADAEAGPMRRAGLLGAGGSRP